MIELELDIEALEALLDHLKTVARTPALDHAFKMLQDAHVDAAEQYWTEKWNV